MASRPIGNGINKQKLSICFDDIIDKFTKFVWIFPTKSTTANETLSKLHIVTNIFGDPRRIISDRGTAFTAEIFQEFYRSENIESILSTTGVPRGNGQVERAHRIIVAALSKLSIENPEKWYLNVNTVQRVMNRTYQRTIDTSPFRLMFGTEMKSKDDIEVKKIIEIESANDFNNEREILRAYAKEQIDKIQKENKKTYDAKRKQAVVYKVGDMVSISRTQFGTGMKLRPNNYGPYEVTKIMGNDRYEVIKIGDHDGPGKTTTSADNMKSWTKNCLNIFESDDSSGSDERRNDRM